MKIITRKELLRLGTVLYSDVIILSDDLFELSEQVYIKYEDKTGTYSKNNNFIYENFPTATPDIGGCKDYFSTMEQFAKLKQAPMSTLETTREGEYEPMETKYVMYEKDDIKKMIDKLNQVLGGYND